METMRERELALIMPLLMYAFENMISPEAEKQMAHKVPEDIALENARLAFKYQISFN